MLIIRVEKSLLVLIDDIFIRFNCYEFFQLSFILIIRVEISY